METRKMNWFALSALSLSLGAAILATGTAAHGATLASQGPGGPPPGFGQEHGGWDEPPQELREAQRRGFHDGVEGARSDFDHHRRPDVERRGEFRHPKVPRDLREDYRDGYRKGYERAMSHLMGGPGPGPGPGAGYGPGR